MTSASAIDRSLDPHGWEQSIDALLVEYIAYARDQHAICRGCPVVRSGAPIVRSMLEWKAAQDGRLNRWTYRDIRDYLLRHLPTSNLSRALLADAPTCVKDLIYFLADRGRLVGEDVAILADATDAVLYGYARPVDLIIRRSEASPADPRRAKRKAARSARRRNRRTS